MNLIMYDDDAFVMRFNFKENRYSENHATICCMVNIIFGF